MIQVIFNADDFGRSLSINQAVLQAHTQGVLTSTSLMVTGESFHDAVALAKGHPSLAVGLHLVVVCGAAVLPPRDIPHLVDSQGRFSCNPFQAGVRYFFSRLVQAELRREIEAQFECFAATGLPLSHVDGHLHMHMHPAVFEMLLPLAKSYGACGVRLPRDNLRLALGYNRKGLATKVSWAIAFAMLCSRAEDRLESHDLVAAQRVYGLMQTGAMEESYVIHLLQSLQIRTAEVYFHPSIVNAGERLGPNPGDLATLISPAVRQAIALRGIQPATYQDLRIRR